MTSQQASAAACLTGGLRTQIRIMQQRDGLSGEEIAEALGVPILLVAKHLAPDPAPQNPSAEDDEAELTSRARAVENDLSAYQQAAAETLGELLNCADSAGIRLMAAKEIIRMRTGDLRRKKETTSGNAVSIQQFNTFIQQAAAVHEKTVKQLAGKTNEHTVIENPVTGPGPGAPGETA